MTSPNHHISIFPFVMYVIASSMILTAFAVVMILQLTLRNDVLTNRQKALTAQTYDRAAVCIISVSPEKRTPNYVKSCYDVAEKSTGLRVEHYGDAR